MKKIKRLAAALLAIAVMLPTVTAIAQSDSTTLTREDVAAALDIVMEEFYDEFGFEFADFLEAIEWGVEGFIYSMHYPPYYSFTVFLGESVDKAALVELVFTLAIVYYIAYQFGGENMILLTWPELVMASVALGDDIWARITPSVVDVDHEMGGVLIGFPRLTILDEAAAYHNLGSWRELFNNPNRAEILAGFGEIVVAEPEYEEHEEYDEELYPQPEPRRMHPMFTRLFQVMTAISLYASEEIRDELLELVLDHMGYLADLEYWSEPEYEFVVIPLDANDMENRKAFASIYTPEFAVSTSRHVNMRINLFFRNESADYAFYYLVVRSQGLSGPRMPFVFIVPPGGERTIQVEAGHIMAIIVSKQGEPVEGEFAIRLTEHPLPQ